MNELIRLAKLADWESIAPADDDQSLVHEACMTLQTVMRPDLNEAEKVHFVQLLDQHAYLEAADILVPTEWSYILTRHRGRRSEVILKVSPETETVSCLSESGGLALLSALTKLVLTSPDSRPN